MNETDHTEVGVLQRIQTLDPAGDAGIVRYFDSFMHEDYYCIVFERVLIE